MAGSVNKVILIGHLGRDPEVRSLSSGGKVVNFRLATSDSWRDKATGERREATEWHTVVIWNEGLAGVAEKYLRKGSKVYVEGKLKTRKWQDQGGADRYSTEVVLENFGGSLTLLDGNRGEGGNDRSSGDQAGDRGGGAGGGERKPFGGGAFDDDLDDDVPF